MKLIHDSGAVLISPLPALLKETVPSQVCLVNAFLLKLVNNLDLGGNGSMVRTRLPQRLVALHPLIADQNILHGIVQGMAHVQLACDVWRRHHDGKWFLTAVYLCVEILSVQPLLVQAVFDVRRVVGFLQFLHGLFSFFVDGFCNGSL